MYNVGPHQVFDGLLTPLTSSLFAYHKPKLLAIANGGPTVYYSCNVHEKPVEYIVTGFL